jgi:iron complex outermembrane recepter protein
VKSLVFARLGLAVFVGVVINAVSPSMVLAEDLGVIQVESSTIDDRFDDKRNEASNIGVIKGDEVDAAHTENIQQMLQSIPGITTSFSSGDSLKIHIRGIENQVYMGEKPGVAVVIDGVPVFERTGAVNIDMDNIESIKVIKGGASYLFGDDALSGAVIITTKRGAHYKGFAAAAEVGDFNYRKGLLRAGFASDNANGHVQVSRRETDGYYDDSASKADYLNGKLQYYIDDTSDLAFGFELSDRWKNSHGSVKGVDAAETDPRSTNVIDYNDYANHFDVNLAKYFTTYSRDISATDNLMVNVYSFGDDTNFLSRPSDSDPTQYMYLNKYKQVQNGLKTEYRSSGENSAWLLAADVRDNSYDNHTEANIDITGWSTTLAGTPMSDDITYEKVQALYGEYKFRVSAPVVMTMNGRFDHIAYDYSGVDYDNSGVAQGTVNADKAFDVASWRLGTNYNLAENSDIYANISTGFRAPSIKQLYAGDISPSGGTDNNPDLVPEHAINMEIGYRTKTTIFGAPTDLDMAIFQIDRNDYIMSTSGQYSANGSTNDMYDNIGGMRNRGLEMAMETAFTPALSWHLAYTYLDAKFTKYDNFNLKLGSSDWGATYSSSCTGMSPTEYCLESYDNTGNVVPRTSNHHLNTSLVYRLTPEWKITGEMDAISSYYADEINRVKIDGHEVFNMLVNYDRAYGDSVWSFFLRVDNVFDKFYYNTARGGTGDSNADGVYDANDISIVVNQGRTYTAGLSVRF